MNFTVDKPLNGHDEDAPAYADDKMLIVCDGLGGGGQNAYLVDGVKRTSAYLGSRRISMACQEFFSAHYEELCANMRRPAPLIAELKTYISEALDRYVNEKGLKNIVRGKSMQMLPSTLAAIIYKHHDDHTDALVISAGDSRAFLLTPEGGLRQISKDDVFDNMDAFEKSATMTNNIRQDGDFHLNYGYYSLPADCILLVCTDGCFDYISTPMELEYRLEYSISKCGDLFAPDKNNLGQYFGNVLVNSGLKDDCTLAGVILGYTDSESTKSLFLKRALQIQKQYRTPWTLWEQESAKRRAEAAAQLSQVEAQISALQADLDATLQSALIAAFQKDLEGTATQPFDGSHEALRLMRSSVAYQSFLSDLNKADAEAARRADEKTAEYSAERNRLRHLFKAMRFDEFVNNLISFHPINFFNSERSRYASEYRRLQAAVNASGRAYTDALHAFSHTFDEFKSIEAKKLRNLNDFMDTSTKYQQLQRAFTEFIINKQQLHHCRESLRSFYMESDDLVEQEFINAWKRKFSAYTTRPQYGDIQASYDRCMDLQTEIDSCVALTRDQKIEKFRAFLEANLSTYLELIKSDPAVLALICGTKPAELAALEKQIEEIKKHSSEFDDKKYALWLEYKPVYELFRHSSGGIV